MTSRDFCFWLQGLFELSDPKQLDEKQTELIRRHLALVFVHEIDPSMGAAEQQAKLNAIHDAKPTAESKPVTKQDLQDLLADRSRPSGPVIMRC